MLKTVFIEGLPGSGKSTTSVNLRDRLSSQSLPVELFIESADRNPFRFGDGTSPEVDPLVFTETIENQWRAIISSYKIKDGFLIQESMTIQQQVNYLLWMNERDKIVPLVTELFELSATLNPHLVYLRQENVVSAFQQAMSDRGKSWQEVKVKPLAQSPYAIGKTGDYIELMASFIREIQGITDDLFGRFPFKKLKIKVTGEWQKHLDEIHAFVS